MKRLLCTILDFLASFDSLQAYMKAYATPAPQNDDQTKPNPDCSLPPQHLVLGTGLGELEANTTASELSVNLRVGVKSVVNASSLLLIKDNLQDLAAILLGAETLANNLNWVDEVGKDSIVDSSESSRTWALLGLRSAGAVGTLWAGENTAGCKDQDVAVRELLLELAGKTVAFISLYFHGPKSHLH